MDLGATRRMIDAARRDGSHRRRRRSNRHSLVKEWYWRRYYRAGQDAGAAEETAVGVLMGRVPRRFTRPCNVRAPIRTDERVRCVEEGDDYECDHRNEPAHVNDYGPGP